MTSDTIYTPEFSQMLRIARGWRIFIYCTCPLMGLVGAPMPFLLLDKNPDAPIYAVALFAVMGLGLVAFAVFVVLDTLRWRLTISPTLISVHSLTGLRRLPREAVAGFTIRQNDTLIHSARADLTRLKIHSTVEQYTALQQWLAARYPNLDKVALVQHQQTVLADVRHGWRPEQRTGALDQARRVAGWLNALGGIVALWLLAYPVPYQLSALVAMGLPIVGVVAIWLHPEVLRIDEGANNAYPSLLVLFMLPAMLLALRALFDYDILNYEKLWQLTGPGAVLLLLALAMVNREFMVAGRAGITSWVLLAFIALPYSFGTTVILNCRFDAVPAVVYSAPILRKYTSGDFPSPTTYLLQLGPWGPLPLTNDEATISKQDYQRLHVGDSVRVALHTGYLNIPWFKVGQR